MVVEEEGEGDTESNRRFWDHDSFFFLQGIIIIIDLKVRGLEVTVMHVLMLHPNHRHCIMEGINKMSQKKKKKGTGGCWLSMCPM